MAIGADGVTNDELLDLIKSTREGVEKGRFEVTFGQQNYYAVDSLMAPENVKMQTGEKATFRVKLDDGEQGAHVLPYEEMDVNVLDLLSKAEEPWHIFRCPLVWNRQLLMRSMDSDGNQILDLLDVARLDAQQAAATEIDAKFFAAPSATDERPPHALQYAVPLFTAGQAGAGFYGGVYSSSFTTVYGISPADSGSNTTAITGGKERWRCWQAGGAGYYTAWDQTLLDTMDNGRMSIQFLAPRLVTIQTMQRQWRDWKILCNKDTRIGLRKLLKDANDQNGTDLAFYENELTYGRLPIVYVAALDAGTFGTYDPIYFLNLNDWRFAAVQGDFMRETDPIIPWNMPDVITASMNLQYAIACVNRRTQAVINKTA